MIVLNQTPITMAEAKDLIPDVEEKPLKDYFKKFVSLTAEKAKSLSEDIRALNNVKVREKDIVKVADLLPKSKEEVNKIFTEVSLSEEESNAIVEIVKKY